MSEIIMYLFLTGCSESTKVVSVDTSVNPNSWFDDCPLSEREQRSVDIGEVALHVSCRGTGATVVFLHGFPEFHYSWNKVMDELSSEFRVIAPDQRGYNLSDKPTEVEAYHLSHLHQDIVNLLPLISPEPVILVAHDWGGPVGWLVAHDQNAHIRAFLSTNGPHPMRFASLIENDPAQQEASAYMNFFRQPTAEDFFTESVLEGMFSDVLSEAELEIYKEAWFQDDAITGGLNWYRANELSVASMEDVMQNLSPVVTIPTKVMWGLDDDAVLPSNAEGLDEYVTDLEVQTFAGVDHWIEHRIPSEIADAIRQLDASSE
jgi:epoxide hydrolase 4